jgi:hypothetical protein
MATDSLGWVSPSVVFRGLLVDAAFINFSNAIGSQADYLRFEFALPVPAVLTEGSVDRLTIRARDNLVTALAGGAGEPSQYAIARGYGGSDVYHRGRAFICGFRSRTPGPLARWV